MSEQNNEELNFYKMGLKRTFDLYTETAKLAEDIEKAYGFDARLEFECGIAYGNNIKHNIMPNFDKSVLDNLSSENSIKGSQNYDLNFDDESYTK